MKKRTVHEIVEMVVDQDLAQEVKSVCVETILKSQLNIHINKSVFEDVLSYCKSDIDKVNKVIHYANIAGLEAVKQLIKG